MFKTIFRINIVVMFLFVFFPYHARAQIAPGVQQSAAQTATITGTVIQADGVLVTGADVRLNGSGAHLRTQSDAHGAFIFTGIPFGTYRITAIVPTLGSVSRDNISVKGDIIVAIQYVAQTTDGLKEIARVSTRSAGAEINVSTASIASINPSDYAFQGNTSWKELLDRIPGVTVGGSLYGGLGVGTTIPDSPIQPIVLSINGALPYETSTTLDGMPLANTSFANVSNVGGGADLYSLSMSTFDTADVVRGPGADAPSIADSIGGSFVLHPPGRVEKEHFEFSAGNDPYGGIVSNAKAAFHFGRFSTTITYGINDSPGPLGSRNVIAAYSWPLVTENGQTFQGCGSPYYFGCSTYVYPSGPPQYTYGNYIIQSALLFDGAPINTAWTQHSGSVALSYDITPSITAQIFYAGLSSGMATPGPEYLVNFVPGPGYTGSLPAGQHSFIYIVGEESKQASSLLEEKLTAYVGRGVVRVAALQNNSFVQEPTSNRLPNGQYTLYGTGCVGPTSPGTLTVFNGTPANLVFSPLNDNFTAWVNNRDALASYAIQVGSSSSFGLSYVTSYYNYPYEYESGSYSYSQPTATSETTTELRIHAGVEVSDKLSLDASWYFAKGTYHVQDPNDPTGNTWTDSTFPYSAPRIGVVWHAARDVAIRAAVGGGYALPVLSNLVGSNAVYLCGPYYQEYKTNLNLIPEKSFGFDLGTDIRLHHDTILSFDLYHTNLYGQFFSSTTLTGTYLGLPLYTSQYENLGQSRFEGISIDIHHDVPKGIYWHGALGLTRAYVVSFPAGFYNSATCSNCANTYIVPGINFDGEFQSTVPYANGSAEVGYRWAPGKYIDLAPTYYGNNNEYFRPAFVEFDVHAGYALTKNVSLLATFRNITGIYGQDYQLVVPATGAPAIVGLPYALYGLPYGPRTVIVTANVSL